MTEFISEFRKGQALQFNWLYEKGAFVLQSDGKFSVDFTMVIFCTFNYLVIFSYHSSLEFVLWKVEDAVESLSREILTIQAKGDKPSAQSLLQSRATLTQPLRMALERIEHMQVGAPEASVMFIRALTIVHRVQLCCYVAIFIFV
jgi:hypothetical protein